MTISPQKSLVQHRRTCNTAGARPPPISVSKEKTKQLRRELQVTFQDMAAFSLIQYTRKVALL